MGWVAGEFSRHRPAQSGQVSDLAQQQRLNNSWLELRDGLQADVNEYNRWGGAAVFEAVGGQQVTISEPNAGLQVCIHADLSNRHLRYDFVALRAETAVPEGGFFSLRLSPAGQAELFSADQSLSCEQARRVLLQPVLFPGDTSTPLQQSA